MKESKILITDQILELRKSSYPRIQFIENTNLRFRYQIYLINKMIRFDYFCEIERRIN